MSKIIFVGDVHLNAQTPQSRKDINPAYPTLILEKLKMVDNIAQEINAKAIIYLGDLFNSPRLNNDLYTFKCMSTLINMKTPQYTIIGNHEMPYDRVDSLFEYTLLAQVFANGSVKHLDKLQIDDVEIVGVDYNKDIPQSDINKYSICVAHAFYENEFYGRGNSNITREQAFNLHYNAYVLGHDHTPYQPIEEPTYKIIRPGSLSRGTSSTCNLYRDVNIEIFDTETKIFEEYKLPVKPGEEVFKERVFLNKSIDDSVEDIIKELDFNQSSSAYEILNQMAPTLQEKLPKTHEDVVSLIKKYFEANGIYDHKIKALDIE